MAIAKMDKFTLLTFKEYKEKLVTDLQNFGLVHLKDLQEQEIYNMEFLDAVSTTEKISYYENEQSKIDFALKKIKPFVELPKGLKAMMQPPRQMSLEEFHSFLDKYDYDKVYKVTKEEEEKINQIKSQLSRLRSEIDSLRSWTEFDISTKEVEDLKTAKYVVGTINKLNANSFRESLEEEFKELYIEFVGNVKEDTEVFILIHNSIYDKVLEYCKDLGFSKLNINFEEKPKKMIADNTEKIKQLEKDQKGLEGSLKDLAAEYGKLEIAYDATSSLLEKEKALQKMLKSESIIIMEGWVPSDNLDGIKAVANNICGEYYYIEHSEVEKESLDVPVKLENNAVVQGFESITKMFSTPKYSEMDPTALLAPFYTFFFGLMMGDTGYGLLMFLVCFFAIKKFNLKEGSKNFMRLFMYLGIGTMIGGALYGSFFGFPYLRIMQTPAGAPKAILDTEADIIVMILASVAVGLVHVIVGVATKGYLLIRDGSFVDAILDSFLWIIAVISGVGMIGVLAGIDSVLIRNAMVGVFAAILLLGIIFQVYTLSKNKSSEKKSNLWIIVAVLTIAFLVFLYIGPTEKAASTALLVSMILLALTQGRANETIIGKIGGGVYGAYGISGYVGDLVSYTRIAALALSGAYISLSFSIIVEQFKGNPVAYIVGGFIVTALGQALNFGLAALGAYVHSCRLQYVEFFGKFFEGGGVPYSPLKINNKFINIKK